MSLSDIGDRVTCRTLNRSKRWASLAAVVMLAALAVLAAAPAAADAPPTDQASLRGSATFGGLNLFVPNRWGLVKARIENHSDQDAMFRLVWWFDAASQRQFARKVWVPAGSMREEVWPARIGQVPGDQNAATGRVLLQAGDSERTYSEQPGSVIVLQRPRPTLVFVRDDLASHAVSAVRADAGVAGSTTSGGLLAGAGPRYTLGWHAVSIAVMGQEQLDLDAAQRRAIRRWVRAGGVLWIMADRVDFQTMAQLLGDGWGMTLVDRVRLNRFDYAFEPGAPTTQYRGRRVLTNQTVELEQPATLARVIAPGYRTWMTVRGWPALLEKRIGAGRVVVTTVHPAGWFEPEAEADDRPWEAAIDAIAAVVYRDESDELAPTTPADSAAFLRRHITYQIAPRWVVGSVLGLYVLAFGVAGTFFVLRQQAGRLAIAAVGIAGATSLTLAGVGWIQRGAEAATNATLQVVYAEPDSSAVAISGSIAMFAPTTRTTELASRRGGWAWPRPGAGETGGQVRLMWTDLDYWKWQDLKIPGGGLRYFDIHTAAELDRPTRLAARFTEAGLVGAVAAPLAGALQDLRIATADALVDVRPLDAVPDGLEDLATGPNSVAFVAGPEQVLPPDVYYAGGLMGTTEQQRSVVFEALARRADDWPARPMLAGWGPLIDDGLSEAESVERRGESLWLIPLNIAPTPGGRAVVVPWPFSRIDPVRSTDARGISAIFRDPRRRLWSNRRPGAAVFDVAPPEAVAPLEVTGGRLLLDIEASGRSVRVLQLVDDRARVLATIESPIGRQTIPLDLAVPAGQTVRLAVDVGPLISAAPGADPSLAPEWQVREVGLELRGVVRR